MAIKGAGEGKVCLDGQQTYQKMGPGKDKVPGIWQWYLTGNMKSLTVFDAVTTH